MNIQMYKTNIADRRGSDKLFYIGL